MNEVCPKYHVPVMLMQSVDAMNIGNGNYVDVTFGGGGHTREILKRMGEEAHLFSFDLDADAIANVPDDNRFTFVYSNFRYLENWMNYYGVEKVDGIMADLGVSSHHFDAAERGFTFRADAYRVGGCLMCRNGFAVYVIANGGAQTAFVPHFSKHVIEQSGYRGFSVCSGYSYKFNMF